MVDVANWIENKNVSQMLNNIDEDEKTKKVTPIYNVYNGQYENQECLFLTVDEDEKLKRTLYVLGQRRN